MPVFWLIDNSIPDAFQELKIQFEQYRRSHPSVSPEQLYEINKLLEAGKTLCFPELKPKETEDLSTTLPVFFSAFRVFEAYAFLCRAPQSGCQRAFVNVFEILVDVMSLYYWLIRRKFDPSLIISTVANYIDNEFTPSQDLRNMEGEYQQYIQYLHQQSDTPYSYFEKFKNNPKITSFCLSFSGQGRSLDHAFAQKILPLFDNRYQLGQEFEIYTNLLSIIRDWELDVVSSEVEKRQAYKAIKDIVVTYYFQLLGYLLLNDVKAKKYDHEVARRQRKIVNPGKCKVLGCLAQPVKCSHCNDFYCDQHMLTGTCNSCISLLQEISPGHDQDFADYYRGLCVGCNQHIKVVQVMAATCEKCSRFICSKCIIKTIPETHNVRIEQVCESKRFHLVIAGSAIPPAATLPAAGAMQRSVSMSFTDTESLSLVSSSRSGSPQPGAEYPSSQRGSRISRGRSVLLEDTAERSRSPSPAPTSLCSICQRITSELVIDCTPSAGAQRWAHKSCLIK